MIPPPPPPLFSSSNQPKRNPRVDLPHPAIGASMDGGLAGHDGLGATGGQHGLGAAGLTGVRGAGGLGVDAADLHDLSVAGGQQGLGAAGLHGVGAASGNGLGVAGVQQGLHEAGGHGQGPSDMAGEAQQLAPCTSPQQEKTSQQKKTRAKRGNLIKISIAELELLYVPNTLQFRAQLRGRAAL